MRVLIVEDETTAAENLAYLLRKVAPDVEIAGYNESVEKTVEWFDRNAVALFLWTYISLMAQHSRFLNRPL